MSEESEWEAKEGREQRKKVSERKTAGREKVSLSLPRAHAVFRTFFDQFSALSWSLEHANENRSLGKQMTFFWVAAWQIQHSENNIGNALSG